MTYQPSLFAHINSRYHATMIRATMKTTLNCMSALSVCLVFLDDDTLQQLEGFHASLTFLVLVGVFNCSMFSCTLLYVPSSFAIILMGKRELVALLS